MKLLGGPGERALLTAACAVGLALRLPWLVADAPVLLSRHGSDDLFYFTQVAHNLATGNGLSFDGLNPTTGVQPLFMLLLVPFAGAFGESPLLACRVVLWLVTLLTLALAWLLPSVGQALCGGTRSGRWAGVLAGCLWVLHPRVLRVTFQGTEAALAALCWGGSLLAWATRASAVRLGTTLGLGALARVDHLVLAAHVVWRRRRAALPMLALFGGWLVLASLTVGSPLQDSGATKRLISERVFALEHGLDMEDPPPLGAPVARALQLATGLASVPARAPVTSAAVLIFAALMFVPRRKAAATTLALVRGSWPLFSSGVLIAVVYLLYLHNLRHWYLMPLMLGGALLTSTLVVDLVGARPRRLAVVALAVLAAAWLYASARPRYHWGDSYIRAAERLAELAPSGSRIGAFNAGIQGAWSTGGRRVVNLDGVVNHGALTALREMRLDDYVRAQGIGWIVDHGISVDFYDTIGGGGLRERLELVDRIEIPGRPESWIGIWRLRMGSPGP